MRENRDMTPDIRQNIEAVERKKALAALAALEVDEGFVPPGDGFSEKARSRLEFGGALLVGVMLGFMTLVFNFMLFVWLFHVEFW
jgi:hypothetical protein